MQKLIEALLLGDTETVVKLLKPAIQSAAEIVREDIKPLNDEFSGYLVNQTLKIIKAYESEGFTRDQAIVVHIGNKVALQDALRKMQSNNK